MTQGGTRLSHRLSHFLNGRPLTLQITSSLSDSDLLYIGSMAEGNERYEVCFSFSLKSARHRETF